MVIHPKEVPVGKMHSYLLGSVVPRPIALASTVDKEGMVNLSPFSFFNVFSAHPPILIFSPSRRGRDNTTKHTLDNVLEVPEVVINIVSYSIVQQTSLASTEYAKGVNEFVKAGLTPIASQQVRPPRVMESPVSFECKVKEVIPLGDQGGAGNLVICEVLLMHIKENILDEHGVVDPNKLDAVARLGGDYYCRVQGSSIFKVPKPLEKKGIGVDQLPEHIRTSKVLTGNDLAMLANVEKLPEPNEMDEIRKRYKVQNVLDEGLFSIHSLAKEHLSQGRVLEAWAVLLAQR